MQVCIFRNTDNFTKFKIQVWNHCKSYLYIDSDTWIFEISSKNFKSFLIFHHKWDINISGEKIFFESTIKVSRKYPYFIPLQGKIPHFYSPLYHAHYNNLIPVTITLKWDRKRDSSTLEDYAKELQCFV